MPWKETDAVTERIKFIEDWLSRKYSMTELCKKHEVSRKTGYKTIKRFKEGGVPALYDQSRAALRSRRWKALLSAHYLGRLQPVFAAMPGPRAPR